MEEKIIYIKSGKCRWGKCIFCGWGKYEYWKLSFDELKEYFEKRLEPVDSLKIFNSGSFLDENQIVPEFRKWIVKKCEELGIENLTVESRPEFVTQEVIDDMESENVKVTVAIGLEVADNDVLEKIQKGFTVEDYLKAVEMLRKNNWGVRTYILVNVPYSNPETLKKSVELVEKTSDSYCLLNWFPHGYSEAFDLWLEGKWKPLDEEEFNEMTKDFGGEKYFYEFVFKPLFPQEKRKWINGATEKQLLHPYYEVWQDYIVRFFKHKRPYALFVPCAFRKPYTKSKLHRAIKRTLREVPNSRDLHMIVISSPGVIPYQFVNYYPFNKYDWKEWEETPEIKKRYIEVTQKRIEDYLKKHKYEKYFCYLKPDSESYTALYNACKNLGIELIDVLTGETYEKVKAEKNSLSLPEALEDLKKNLVF